MPVYEFKDNDILYNSVEAHPHYEFYLYSGSVYLNNFSSSARNLPNGYVSLHEMNVDRDEALHTWEPDTGTGAKNLIYPFITKDGSGDAFATVSTSNFRFGGYGDVITGSYMMTASIDRKYMASGSSSPHRSYIKSLRNTVDLYKIVSPRCDFDKYDYDNHPLGLISIPSIFYGSSIEKGSVRLKMYVTGTLVAELHDVNKNGELIQVTGSTTGTCEGVVLYNEGFLILTGTKEVVETTDDYNVCEISGGVGVQNSFSWSLWGEMGSTDSSWGSSTCIADDGSKIKQSSYGLEFKGTTRTPTLTMLAHAPKGELNHSNNLTYTEKNAELMELTGSKEYIENRYIPIKNTMSSSYDNFDEPFSKQTFISTIKIYDENNDCIAIAKLARPIKKLEERGYTFKLNLDI